ncbi:MAG: CoxG family protein [Thermoplasmata archaeon]
MEFEGTFSTSARIEKVWSVFFDPQGMKPCVPDLELLEIFDPMHHRLVFKVGLSFIKGKFDVDVQLQDVTMPTHARVKAHGTGQGSGVDVDAVVDLVETPGGTEMRWKANAHIVGKLASVGSRLIDSTVEKRINEFFECGRARLEGAS